MARRFEHSSGWSLTKPLCATALFGAAAIHADTHTPDMLDALPAPAQEVVLEVHGNIARSNDGAAALFDMAMLRALPPATLETATTVTDGVHSFEGVLLRDLLARVGAGGEVVTAIALNDYVIDIPTEDFERFDVLLAYRKDGKPLLPSGKGPLWIVYPRDHHDELQDIRYDYRWVWQLYRLDIQ